MKKLCITLTLLLTFSLLLSSCSDYTYEPQQLITDEIDRAADFQTFYAIKILYKAAGKGEEEFNRAYKEMINNYHKNNTTICYEYYGTTGKYRDEFLTAYNDYKDIQILGTKDDYFTDGWCTFFPYSSGVNSGVKNIQYRYRSDEANSGLSLLFHDKGNELEFSDESCLLNYTGKTFTAKLFETKFTHLYDEDGVVTVKHSYYILVYDLNGVYCGRIAFYNYSSIQGDSRLEERITRWLDHFYLAPLHEVVQNAKAP